MKLAPDNYLSWRAQVLPLLRNLYLEGYVDGSIPCPPSHHPAYHTWVAQDQAILSAIQSSLTPSVSSVVIFAATSREAWAALHTSFASQSQARAHSIRTELGETKCRCKNWRISGSGSRTVRLGRMVTGGREHDVLPRFGPS